LPFVLESDVLEGDRVPWGLTRGVAVDR